MLNVVAGLTSYNFFHTGKIDLQSADKQSQDQQVLVDEQYHTLNTSNNESEKRDWKDMQAFDICLNARGNVRVETMSWIQIIRSKYGFSDTKSTGAVQVGSRTDRVNIAPGRTASSSAIAAEMARSNLYKENQ